VYGLIVYSLIGFDWTVEKFFWYMFFMFFTFMYFTFYGMMAVAMTPNSDIAAIVSTAFYAIWNIFAGFLIPRPVSVQVCNSLYYSATTQFSILLMLKHTLLGCRGYQYGGDGTHGHVRWLGHYMDLWPHSLEISQMLRWKMMGKQ
jgi:glucan phosphoethanolaminetransferase (alkaline phosphatase superfamily)